MKSLRFLDRRAGNRLASIALILGTLVPSLIPALAFADQVTGRSITLSSSAAGAANVTYEVKFTAIGDAAGFVLDFCSDSPIPGQTCTAPTGFDASSAATGTSGATLTKTASTIKVTKAIDVSTDPDVDVVITGIHNPTDATTSSTGFYARILTYDDVSADTDFDDYTATTIGSPVDQGGVALAITNSIGVTAAVRETMTFCVASADITADCANASGNLPTFELGETVGNAKALSPTAVSTATLFAQLSTNAATGAVVNLKSNTTGCGGLKRIGSSACDIAPATSGGISQGQAKFGVKTAADSSAATGAQSPTGHLLPSTGYSDSAYFLDYVSGDGSGVTSTYGGEFLNTNSLPVNNQNQQITLGASASANTPAGTYAATLNMIASGTY